MKKYNTIVQEQFKRHCIEERLNAVNNMTKYCGYQSPRWLLSMIITLYKQMTEIQTYAKKNCRFNLQPDDDFSPTIQMWYNRIHVYLQLIQGTHYA